MTAAQREQPKPVLFLRQRADVLAVSIQQSGADGWLVYDFRGSNPAFARLIGIDLPQSTRRAFLLITATGDARLVIHHVDAGNFERLGLPVRAYGSREEMLQALGDTLGAARRVLMEYSPGNAIPYVSRVDGGTLELVRALGVEVLSSADALASVVARWDGADLASHERAARALEESKDALFEVLRGVLARGETWTEVDAQSYLVGELQRRGMEFDHPPIVAVDAHAGDPHYAPAPETALAIRRGSLLLTDLWVREARRPDGKTGAYADVTWMATAAERIPEEQERVWQVVRDARDAAVRLLQERLERGARVQGGEVDQAARRHIAASGYGDFFTHRTGHSIGWNSAHGDGVNIDDYETHDTRVLRPGASFSIEPGVYLPTFGVRSEIDCVVTERAELRVTTEQQRDLVRLA